MEKFYSSKAWLKMAGGGDAFPTSTSLDPPLGKTHALLSAQNNDTVTSYAIIVRQYAAQSESSQFKLL